MPSQSLNQNTKFANGGDGHLCWWTHDFQSARDLKVADPQLPQLPPLHPLQHEFLKILKLKLANLLSDAKRVQCLFFLAGIERRYQQEKWLTWGIILIG